MEPKQLTSLSAHDAAVLEQVRTYVTAKMKENDPAHDDAHIRRVADLTAKLCEKTPGVHTLRAMLIAYLHDMQDDKLASNTDGEILREALLPLGVDPEDADFALKGIGYISFRKYPKLSPRIPIEIRIVQDADRIDAMGAIGVARTFAFGGAKGRPLEESILHFEEKLLKLYDLLSTEAGRVLAAPRHELLLRFYNAYREEEGISPGPMTEDPSDLTNAT